MRPSRRTEKSSDYPPRRGHAKRHAGGHGSRYPQKPRTYPGGRGSAVAVPHTRERPDLPQQAPTGNLVEGVLDLHDKGYGFLRNPLKHFSPQPGDAYVSQQWVDRFRLRPGLLISGRIDPNPNPNGGGPRLLSIEKIEGADPQQFKHRDFDSLTPIDPREWLKLETGAEPLTTRVMDLLTPIGRGQRGLIVAPPRSGKTILLQHVALAVAENYPDMDIIMLLVDERPEEVTEMKRTIKGQVFASSSDQTSEVHVRLAELVFERCKRLTEQGRDVFLLLDSLTRLARAYNKEVGTSGRTMTGGIDVHALEIPKRLFGAARAFEEGGSLTVLGTALIETGSKMDDIIFQEFKGTGNMELVLERKLAERRIYPAIEICQSGTRKEERLLPADIYKHVTMIRRTLAPMNSIAAMTLLVEKLSKYKSNADFFDHIKSALR